MKKVFNALGFDKAEADIYRQLVRLGVAGVAEIARATGLYRQRVYFHLPILIKRQLVSESRKGKRKVYYAESPKRLERLLEVARQEYADELSSLNSEYSRSGDRPRVKYFEGEKAMRYIYDDLLTTLKKGDVYYRYESPKTYDAHKKYVPREYKDRFRDKIEVERYIITNSLTKDLKQKRLGRYVKAVPKEYDLFAYDISQLIYGNKVAFVDFQNKVVSIMESPTFAEFQRKIFKLLFDKL